MPKNSTRSLFSDSPPSAKFRPNQSSFHFPKTCTVCAKMSLKLVEVSKVGSAARLLQSVNRKLTLVSYCDEIKNRKLVFCKENR